jgi:hypothetical protein
MFIFLESDSQSAQAGRRANTTKSKRQKKGGDEESAVRRHYRGIQIKDDRYAVISIRDANGEPIPLVSESMIPSKGEADLTRGEVREYADFILQQVTEERVEKQQIVETFGDTYVYFFGERPRVVTFSGLLVNTEDFNWRSQFWYNYERYLRGTKLVQVNARAYFAWDSIVVEGFPLQASAVEAADNPYAVQFQMSMLLSNYFDFTNVGSIKFPAADAYNLDALNTALDVAREQYMSTTVAVRYANAFPSSKGVLATIRDGFKSVNEFITNPLGQVPGLNRINQVLGGRVERLPIGVAGSIAAAGDAQFAGTPVPGMFEVYDERTGQLQSLTGSVKIRFPNYTKFAPVGKFRTVKSDNVDEYPLRRNRTLEELIGPAAYFDELTRIEKAQFEKSFKDELLQCYNAFAAAGGALETIGEVVDVVQEGFGMVMNLASLAAGGDEIIAAQFDFGGIASSFGSSWHPFGPLGNRLGRIRDKAQAMFSSNTTDKFVGADAQEIFEDKTDRLVSEADPVTGDPPESTIGESYETSTYTTTDGSLAYEPIYGTKDYSTPIALREADTGSEDAIYSSGFYTQSSAADPRPHFQEKGYINDAERKVSTQRLIDEVYGDSNAQPQSVSEAVLELLYGPNTTSGIGVASEIIPDDVQRLRILQQVMSGATAPRDESTRGIRGEEEADAKIEPVI